MIDRHWDGIAAYCKPENKVSLGFVEGPTTKSASSSDAPTACATKNIFASRFSPACCRRSDRRSAAMIPQNHPLKLPEDPLKKGGYSLLEVWLRVCLRLCLRLCLP